MSQAPTQPNSIAEYILARRQGMKDALARTTHNPVELLPKVNLDLSGDVPIIRSTYYNGPINTDLRNFERPQTFGTLLESNFRDMNTIAQAARISYRTAASSAPDTRWLDFREEIADGLPEILAGEGLNPVEIDRVMTTLAESQNTEQFMVFLEENLDSVWDQQQFQQAGFMENIAAALPAVIADPTAWLAGAGVEKAAVQFGARMGARSGVIGASKWIGGGVGMSASQETARALRDSTSPITDEVTLEEHLANIAVGALLDGAIYMGGKTVAAGARKAFSRSGVDEVPPTGAARQKAAEAEIAAVEATAPPLSEVQDARARAEAASKPANDAAQEYVASGQQRMRRMDFMVEDADRFAGAKGFDSIETAAGAMGVKAPDTKPPAPRRLTNADIAARFDQEVADLRAKGGQGQRAKSLEKAAQAIREHGTDIFDLTDAELKKIPGIGVGSVRRIREILEEARAAAPEPEAEVVAAAGSPEPRVRARSSDGRSLEFVREPDAIVVREEGEPDMRLTIDEADRTRVFGEGEPMRFNVTAEDGSRGTFEFSPDRKRVSFETPDTPEIVAGTPEPPGRGAGGGGAGDGDGGGGNIFGDGKPPPDDVSKPMSIGDALKYSGNKLNDTSQTPRNATLDDSKLMENAASKAVAKFQRRTTATNLSRIGLMQEALTEAPRIVHAHFFNPVRGFMAGVASGKFAGIETLESLTRRVSSYVNGVHKTALQQAQLLGRPAIDKMMSEGMSGRLFDMLPIVGRSKRVFQNLRSLVEVADIIRMQSDSIDGATFGTVYESLPAPLKSRVDELIRQTGHQTDRFGKAIDKINEERRLANRNATETFFVNWIDELFLIRIGDNAVLQHFADMEHALKGGDGPAPSILTKEGAELLRSRDWAKSVIPEDFAARKSEWSGWESQMRSHFNKNLLGNVGRPLARKLSALVDETGAPIMRHNSSESLTRASRIYMKMGALHKLRLIEDYMLVNNRGIQPVDPSATVPDFSPSNYNMDLDRLIGNEIQQRKAMLIDQANREAGDAPRHSRRVAREIRVMGELIDEIAGNGQHMSPGQQLFAEIVRNVGRSVILPAVAVAQVGDYSAYTGKMLLADKRSATVLAQSLRGFSSRFARMTPEQLKEAAPTVRLLKNLLEIQTGMTAHNLHNAGGPFAELMEDGAREGMFSTQAQIGRENWAMSALSDATQSWANLVTAGTAFTDGRLRHFIFEGLRIASPESVVALAKHGNAENAIRAGANREMVISLAARFTQDELQVLDGMMQGGKFWIKAPDGTILPTGMALMSRDPEVQRTAAAAARQFAGAQDELAPTAEMMAKFELTAAQERVLHKYADWMDSSIADHMVIATGQGDRLIGSIRGNMFGSLGMWLLTFAEKFSALWIKSMRSNPRAGAAYAGGMLAGAILVDYLKAVLRGDQDEYMARVEDDPVKWLHGRIAWSGMLGAIGERVSEGIVSVANEQDRTRLRAGFPDERVSSVPIMSSFNRLQQGAAAFIQSFTEKGATENEFKKFWSLVNFMEGAAWQLPFRALGQDGFGIIEDENPVRDALIRGDINIAGWPNIRREEMSKKDRDRIINAR